MGFLKIIKADISSETFGKERYLINSKERKNLSKAKLDLHNSALYIDYDKEPIVLKGGILADKRYIAGLNLTYDVMISIYNPTTSDIAILRFCDLNSISIGAISSKLRLFQNGKYLLEMRLIGMQNDQPRNGLSELLDFVDRNKLDLVDADLFGKDVRNIVFDSTIGLPFNLLTESRLYKPGELANKVSYDEFKAKRNQQPFEKDQKNSKT